MDTYIPDGQGPFPAIVLIHGGAWVRGSKHDEEFVALGEEFAKKGFACFSIDYTLTVAVPSIESAWPVIAQDVVCALRHIKSNAGSYRIDPQRMAVWGTSAGGHLASLVGTLDGTEPFLEGACVGPSVSSRVALVIDYYGPTDFDFIGSNETKYDRTYEGVYVFLGDVTYSANPSLWHQASPASYISSDDPVFVIAQGTQDREVDPEISKRFAGELTAANIETHLIMVQGADHGFKPEEEKPIRCKLEPIMKRLLRP